MVKEMFQEQKKSERPFAPSRKYCLEQNGLEVWIRSPKLLLLHIGWFFFGHPKICLDWQPPVLELCSGPQTGTPLLWKRFKYGERLAFKILVAPLKINWEYLKKISQFGHSKALKKIEHFLLIFPVLQKLTQGSQINGSLGIWKSQFLGWEVGRGRGLRQKTLLYLYFYAFCLL